MDVPSDGPPREVSESQKALELRKFFAPYLYNKSPAKESYNDGLTGDGALSAYAETVIWRLKGVHCMVSLIDRTEQYFIAGASRVVSEDDEYVSNDPAWFGCATVPTAGGLCENTLALDPLKDGYPCFIINDLSLDDRFAALPVVDGSIAAYRFYAGTPITTRHGINIGSFFIFDVNPREGLSLRQRKFLHEQAANVMKHLETKREAEERRRITLMSNGIATFLERTSQVVAPVIKETRTPRENGHTVDSAGEMPVGMTVTDKQGVQIRYEPVKDSIVDKIRFTLCLAADILRESLELVVGGVVFLDAAIGYNDTGNTNAYLDECIDMAAQVPQTKQEEEPQQGPGEGERLRPSVIPYGYETSGYLSQQSIRSSTDKNKAPKVQAISAAKVATWDPQLGLLDGKTLQSFINSYPKGNVWYIDEAGYFSSLEQTNELQKFARPSPSGRNNSVPAIDVTKQQAEAALLSQIFHKARQIIFLPLWDAGGDRWYSGCFVWNQSPIPVFTAESELPFLSAFTNSVMVEISRLDAIAANKVKSDFISSISHEFRSPLHGILASAELIRDSDLDASQIEFVSTIQNCSGTLLDTINHVLDYSKINSFENAGNQPGTISNELYQITNLALLCEDLVNGMITAAEFRGGGSGDSYIPLSNTVRAAAATHTSAHSLVEIIIDIERHQWDFKVQAGALRRVIMNVFGNAQKYTESGYILVQLGIRRASEESPRKTLSTTPDILSLHIRDSGRGMSSHYMERRLYSPFAQEDSFSTGLGLGLSIVWSIVNQLGGKIHIRSEKGKGTDVEVTLPVERADGSDDAYARPGDFTQGSDDAQEAIKTLRLRAYGKILLISRDGQNNGAYQHKNVSWNCMERYCSEWFGYQVIRHGHSNEKSTEFDLVITDDYDALLNSYSSAILDGKRILVVHNYKTYRQHHKERKCHVRSICSPVGPFKLARSILALLDEEMSASGAKATNQTDVSTQTPLPSPEERTSVNGTPLTDYGFTPQSNTFSGLIESPISEDPSRQSPQVPKVQDDGSKQGLASLRALSIQLSPRRTAETETLHEVSTLSKPETPASQKSPTIPQSPTTLNILAVDDNALNLQLIHRYLLKRKSDKVVTAKNGVEAVAAVREAANVGQSFDVILMDISMPEMDGFEATRLIRSFERSFAHRSISEDAGFINLGEGNTKDDGENERPPHTRVGGRNRAYVVALTGLASRRDRDEAKESGFDEFLTKPVSFVKIGGLLQRLSAASKGGVIPGKEDNQLGE